MEKPKLIIFDLNKTLIHENSWQLLNAAMGLTTAEDDMLVSWGNEGIISDAQGQAIICALYRKRAQPTRENILNVLKSYTYLDYAQSTIQSLTDKGYKLALLSGSMDILVEHIANELGIGLWACNNYFNFDGAGMLQTIRTIDNDDSYKAGQLESMCKKLDIKPTETMCVGDGDNDALLFDLSRCGVTFEDSSVKDRAKYTISRLDNLLDFLV